MNHKGAEQMKLLRINEVTETIGLSTPSIYRLMAEGKFPRPIKIGQRAVAWRKKDLKKWIKNRPKGGQMDI